jgi:hypothetical protein
MCLNLLISSSRITNRTVSDMTESAKATSAELVEMGLYDDIEAAATIDDNIIRVLNDISLIG